MLERKRDKKREREVEMVKKRGLGAASLAPVFLGQDWALQQGARGALWRGWGVCGAVAHGQDVVVAGNVAVPREVVRTLGESGRQAVGSLKNTHCRFHVIDVPAGSGQGCASAGAKGQVSVRRRLHLHVAAFSVLAGQAGRISDGGVWVLTV